jgi:hypothetical protein
MKMKFVSVTVVLVAISPILQADALDLAVNGNPYTPIVTRNIFGLLPIPTNAPAVDPASLNPPPKITPNGIMTIFGTKEALYKVAGQAKPGKPAMDQSYTMSEGESQDDIEVVKIDDDADVITFNNHGVIQELPLVVATATSGGTGPSVPSSSRAMGGDRFPRPLGGSGFAGHRGLPLPNTGFGGSAGATPSVGGTPSYGGGANPVSSFENNPELKGLSPEAQALLIEQNRIDTQDMVDQGKLPPLPPTPITPADAKGQGGFPLLIPPETVK